MNLSFWDYGIITFFALLVIWSVTNSRRYVRSVSDFLATNRSTGRYLLSISQGLCGVGAISILAFWQQNFTSGFAMAFWGFSMNIVVLVVAVSGWISYRYRQTRCLTLAQFFEQRYSRKFRVFAGAIAFIAGIINYGIFPAIEAHFFINFCGIPYSTLNFALVMIGILSVSIIFVWIGGQVAVVMTDFFQGLFVSLAMVFLVGAVLMQVGWDPIITMLQNTQKGQSLVNPFDTGDIEIFNFWFFIINVLIVIYNKMSWQGTQGFNSCAKNAHEAKMGEVLSSWRGFPYGMMYLVIPIACCAVLSMVNQNAILANGETFSSVATQVQGTLSNLRLEHSDQVAEQMKTPLVLIYLLPDGIKGLLVVIMIAASISTHASYLHSWGSIFVQDVLIPIRGKPFEQKKHLNILRWAIFGVSVFAFTFSMYFTPNEAILPFMMITGAIFVGGSGAVLIGGLYWKRGCTAAAWAAMIVGSLTATTATILPNLWGTEFVKNLRTDWMIRFMDYPDIVKILSSEGFPLGSQWMTVIAMGLAISVYIIISLLSRTHFDLEKLLHRGPYAIAEDIIKVEEPPTPNARIWKLFGMGKDFTWRDKLLVLITYAWTFGWMGFSLLIMLIHAVLAPSGNSPFTDVWWISFWEMYIWLNLGIGLVVTVWFAIGGTQDLAYMFKKLKGAVRDESDDGFVYDKKDPPATS